MARVIACTPDSVEVIVAEVESAARQLRPFFLFFEAGEVTGCIGDTGETMADVLRAAELVSGIESGGLADRWAA